MPDDISGVLNAAADWLEQPGNWGKGYFVDPDTGCRCALGAIALTGNPNEPSGDPTYGNPLGDAAAHAFADYLVDELGAPSCFYGDDEEQSFTLDVLETVGGWNDAQDSPEPVVAALRACAEQVAS